jgi:hypothetical protein
VNPNQTDFEASPDANAESNLDEILPDYSTTTVPSNPTIIHTKGVSPCALPLLVLAR